MGKDKFAVLADAYMDMVYRVALNCVKHPADADDVTQNVMLRLLKTGPDFTSEEHACHWLIRVAVNESKRLLTAPWRSRTISLEQPEGIAQVAESGHSELLETVLELPVKYRLPLYLYYYEGYSVEEIGKLLNRPGSTIQTQLARGRERLKKALTEE